MRPNLDGAGRMGLASTLGRCWTRMTTSRYTRHLEDEVERLRADRDEARRQVWALINSLVTTAGAPLPQGILRQAQEGQAEGASGEKQPLHRGRKSWHQRALALEIETARELQRILGERKGKNTANEDGGGQGEAKRS